MLFEHFALNVSDVRAHAHWYVAHAGFRIVRQLPDPPFIHFLADSAGRVVVELFTRSDVPIPNYPEMPPPCFHLALVSSDARADRARLTAVGATFFSEDNLADGGRLIMMRDPWGVPLQLCQRVHPF
jgi:glyoxylase I family protein